MNANASFKEKSKLLVAVMAMFVVFAGAAVIFGGSGVDATPSETQTNTSMVSMATADGEVYYDTLEEAISAVPTDNNETTITLLKDSEGAGIKVVSGQNIIIDFNDHTYKVTKTVGSPGTETNAAQLLKGSTVTFKDGTFTSDTALRMIQNYSDLTLENMVIDGSEMKPGYSSGAPVDYIAVATNCGEVVLKGTTTIIDKDPTGDKDGRGALSLAVSHWDIEAYGNEGTSVTFDSGYTGTIASVTIDHGGSYGGTGTAAVYVEADNVKIGTMDVTYGTFQIEDAASVLIDDLRISEGAQLKNSGSMTVERSMVNDGNVLSSGSMTINGDYQNNGLYVETVDGGVTEYHVGSWDTFNQALTDEAQMIVLENDITMEATSYLRAGQVLDLNGYTLTVGSNMFNVYQGTVDMTVEGSTLLFSGVIKTNVDSFETSSNSTIVMSGSGAAFYNTNESGIPGADDKKAFPYLEDGSKVVYQGNTYTIRHQVSGDITLQYGISLGDVYYTGSQITKYDVPLLAQVFDIDGRSMIGSSYEVTGEYIDAGTYPEAIDVQLAVSNTGAAAGAGTITFNDHLDLTILPAESELQFGDYVTDDVYGVAKDALVDGAITAVVNGTDVTLTGTLLYYSGNGWDANVWPAGETEGYYVLFAVDWQNDVPYDSASVVLSYSDKTYSAETFDNFMLVYLGKAPELGSMQMTVDYDGEGTNFAETTYDISFASLSLQSYIYIGEYADETVYDVPVAQLVGSFEAVQDGHAVTITADLYYYAGGAWAAGTWAPGESEGYYIVFSVDNPTGAWAEATFKVNGSELSTQPFDGYLVNYLGTVLPETESVEIAVDLDGVGAKYTESQFTVNMALTSSVSIFFDAIDSDDTYDIGEVSIGDLQSEDTAVAVDSVEGEENVYNVVFTGTLNWVSDYTWYNSAVEAEQRGYYLGFDITLPGNMSWDDAVLKTENKTFDSENPFDGFFIWRIVNDYDSVITIEIDGTTYTYNLDFSQLSFAPKAGFVPVAEDILDGEDYVIEGIALPDVIDNTYYLIFNTGKTEAGVGDYTMMLFKGESAPADLSGAVYTETVGWQQIADGAYIWYISLDDQLKGLDLAGGDYTLAATVGGEVVAQATIMFGGTIDCGYDESAEDASNGMIDAGIDPTAIVDDVSDQTMWIVWNNATAETAVKAVLTLDGKEIYSQDNNDVPRWLNQGIHVWYFCFGDNPGSIKSNYEYGTYVMTVTDADGNVLAQGEIVNQDMSQFTVMLDEKDDAYDREFVLKAGTIFYLPESGIKGETVQYWEVLDENGEVVGTVNAGAIVVMGSTGVYFSSENVYSFKAYYAEGGDVPGTETGPVYQLPEYKVETVVDEGSLIVNVSVDRLNGYNGFSALRISYTGMVSDYDGYIPWIIDSPNANGIVASCNVTLYADDEITGPVMVTVLAFIGDTWEPIGSTIVDVGGTVTEESLLNDDVDGNGNSMTFTVIETPTPAPEEHNYPWLQVNYERLQDVDSVELMIDGESISFNWVDQDGNAIEQPETIPAGEAFFQLSYADGDVVAGDVIEITIRVTAGEATDEITMTITVPTPDSEY